MEPTEVLLIIFNQSLPPLPSSHVAGFVTHSNLHKPVPAARFIHISRFKHYLVCDFLYLIIDKTELQ